MDISVIDATKQLQKKVLLMVHQMLLKNDRIHQLSLPILPTMV